MNEHHGLAVEAITNGPFIENCYLLIDTKSHEAAIVDPGDEAQRILAAADKNNAKVTQLLATHGHLDHIGDACELQEKLQVPFAIHPDDAKWIHRLPDTQRMYGIRSTTPPIVNSSLIHNQDIRVGTILGHVLHTPGHTPGGCCLYFADARVVFVGDTLFEGSIGRTDLPGGDHATLLKSIREQLLTLPDDVIVYSGHGEPTTIKRERDTNPFLR